MADVLSARVRALTPSEILLARFDMAACGPEVSKPQPSVEVEDRRRIRVLRVIARLNAGGPAHHVSLLSGMLDPTRYETVLVAGTVGPGETSFEDLATRYGARLNKVDSLGPQIRPIADLRALISLIRIVRRFRPHIVDTHTAKAGLLGRAAALFIRPRPIIVHTFHGHVLEQYFGLSQTTLFRLLERSLARVSNCLIGVSNATVDDLVRLRIAPREKFRVIKLGLALDRFTALNDDDRARFRHEIGAGTHDLLLTYVGRLVPIKRVDLLICAVAKAREAGASVRLAIVGDGALRQELEAFARTLKLDECCRFLGYRNDLEAITAGCDVAVLASDNEGTPVWLIEAAAAGRPAIATAVGGVPEVVSDTGILVSRGNQQGLTDAIVRLAGEPGLRDELGRRARDRVTARFSSKRLLREIDALYTELLVSR